jgi:hypothetical protein
MYRSITLIYILLQFINSGYTQDTLSSNLLKFEKAIYYATSDTSSNRVLVEKMNFLIENKVDNKQILANSKRINRHLITSQDEKSRFLWNSCVAAYLENDLYYSLHCMKEYQLVTGDSSVECESLRFFIYTNYDKAETEQIISNLIQRDSIFLAFKEYHNAQLYEVNYRGLKKIMAYVVPGAGMMLNGNFLKGFISLALNSASVSAIYYLVSRSMYINSIAWGSNLILKFYLGNVNLTDKLIEAKQGSKRKKLAKKCELSINECLIKYPIDYR